MASLCSQRPICAPPCLSAVFQRWPWKRCQRWSGWTQIAPNATSFSTPLPSGDQCCDALACPCSESESERLRRSTQITGVIRRGGFALIIEILQFWMNWQMQSGRCCCPGGSTPQQFYRRRSFEVDQFCMGELQSICHCSLCNCLWCC